MPNKPERKEKKREGIDSYRLGRIKKFMVSRISETLISLKSS